MALVCSVILIVQMFWRALIIEPAAWGMADIMLLLFATRISISILVHIISKLFGRQVAEELGVAVAKLSAARIALRRLGSIQTSEKCIEWLHSVDDLQRGVEKIEVGYDGCGLNYLKRISFSQKAGQMLHRANNLLNRIDAVNKLLDELLAEEKSSSSSSNTSRQLARPHMHTGRDVQPDNLQDMLPGMTDYYKKVRCFIEAEGAQSLLLGVWGMRGVGKTTLLRVVRDSYTGKACFDHIMFVGAGTGCVMTNVQDAIAINLGLDLTMMSSLDESSRATNIFNYLEHKSFLLLLDDIREPLNWWAVGLPTSSHTRQKIILATRTGAACDLMGCRSSDTIEMRCLGADDGWKLFKDKAGLGFMDDHPQVHHIAKQMVSLCGGLPLALCAIGRAMSNKKDPREWRSAYSQLRAIHMQPHEINEKVCTSILNPLYCWREDTILIEQVEGKTTSVLGHKSATLPRPEDK